MAPGACFGPWWIVMGENDVYKNYKNEPLLVEPQSFHSLSA